MSQGKIVIVDHPLVQHKLTLMRDKTISTGQFRRLLQEIAPLILYEATRDLPLMQREIETPVARCTAPVLAGKKLCFVPILRAGLAFVDAMLDLIPSARVGHIGLFRDPVSLEAVEYYVKLPEDVAQRLVILVDPMLATGHSAVAAIDRIKRRGAETIKFICLVAAPPGLATVNAAHPDVPVYAAALDPTLNDHAYIVPGLGDAGDRLFGTK
jgi:uracil phosphoribosyltransferase